MAWGRCQVSWLPGLPPRAFPVRSRRASGVVRGASPVTVAGPRRNRTGFPVHRPLNGAILHSPVAVTVNLTRIYTKLGDTGETHLGDMSRVAKTHPRIEAYGTVDELNAHLGLALTVEGLDATHAEWIRRVQNDLFDVGADTSVPHGGDRARQRVAPEQITWLEERCDEVNATLESLKSFVLPGGSAAAAHLHVCRTIARRGERRAILVEDANPEVVRSLTRLGDPLFTLSRAPNAGPEPLWQPGRFRPT